MVFEDLDRLGNTEVFVKLREINQIINNNLHNQPIRFIYACRDDIFLGADIRTKFFDFILPVVPVMDARNAYTHLKNKLKGFPADSLALLKQMSMYISDMRSLQNIVNEFNLFSQVVNDDKNHAKIFALIFYKNIYAQDYNLTDKKSGMLYAFIHDYRLRKLHENYFHSLDKKLEQLTDKLEKIKKESATSDRELYREWISKLDMVLWVLKADARAFSVEEQFYQTVFTEYNGELPAITWVLNQVDKIEPVEQWHLASAQPSKQQQVHITLKRHAIAKQMHISVDTIIPISVKGRYHLPQLVETIITHLPKQARSPLIPHLQNTYQTTTVINHARSSFGDTVVDIIERVIDFAPLPQIARHALKSTTHHIAQAARSVWSFFFS